MIPKIDHKAMLTGVGLRPTRQRLLLAGHLFDGYDKHFTAEDLHRDISAYSTESVSLATVYNTLNSFTEAGLLTTVSVDAGKLYFDTNTQPHYHIYDGAGRALTDIAADGVKITGLPDMPGGQALDRVDIIIRTKPA